MFKARFIVLSMLTFAVCNASFSQEKAGKWEGAIAIGGGSNFKVEEANLTDFDGKRFSNIMGDASARVGYRRGKFSISASASYNKGYKTTLKDAVSATMKQKDTTVVMEDSHSFTDRNTIKSGMILGYDFDARNNLKMSYSYTREGTDFIKENITADFTRLKLKGSEENGHNVKQTHLLQASYRHAFNKASRVMTADLSVMFGDEYQNSDWQIGSADTVKIDMLHYRVLPVYFDMEYKLSSHYFDTGFLGVRNLSTQFGVDLRLKTDDDETRAETEVGGVWVDKTGYHELFKYRSLTVAPQIHAGYKTGNLDLSATFVPELFTQKFSNEEQYENLNPLKANLVFDLGFSYKFNAMHRLGFNASRKIKRPEYKQICWYLRTGAYYNEFFKGNPGLLPQVTYKLNLDYFFTAGKFSSILELGANFEERKIEQTFYKDTLNGLPCRIKTWINSGITRNPYVSIQLKWNGKQFKADAKAVRNYSVNINNEGKVKQNADWNITSSLGYYFKYDWAVIAKFRYQSKIIHNYTSKTEYIGCDVRAQKKFGRFIVYAEGRDLFDNAITTETISSDNTSIRSETVRNCRRIFLLGVNVAF